MPTLPEILFPSDHGYRRPDIDPSKLREFIAQMVPTLGPFEADLKYGAKNILSQREAAWLQRVRDFEHWQRVSLAAELQWRFIAHSDKNAQDQVKRIMADRRNIARSTYAKFLDSVLASEGGELLVYDGTPAQEGLWAWTEGHLNEFLRSHLKIPFVRVHRVSVHQNWTEFTAELDSIEVLRQCYEQAKQSLSIASGRALQIVLNNDRVNFLDPWHARMQYQLQERVLAADASGAGDSLLNILPTAFEPISPKVVAKQANFAVIGGRFVYAMDQRLWITSCTAHQKPVEYFSELFAQVLDPDTTGHELLRVEGTEQAVQAELQERIPKAG